jgi:xanthine/CO dehydrogenase XdhC/CoxF family maturation factor
LRKAAANGAQLGAPLIAQLRGPIGLDPGDRSPAGIAPAVAEILAPVNGRGAQPLAMKVATETLANARRICHV